MSVQDQNSKSLLKQIAEKCDKCRHDDEVRLRNFYQKRHKYKLETQIIKRKLKLPEFDFDMENFVQDHELFKLFVAGFDF
jgi:translation initiation factor IF-2